MKLNKIISADMAVLIALAGFTIWYLSDAWSVSSDVENLVLIMPISIAILLMCCWEFFKNLFREEVTHHDEEKPIKTVVPVIGLFSIYVLGLEWLGFDVATILFVAAFLWLQGERRWHWLIAYSLCFGFFVAVFFSSMLPYPMPMLLLPTDY